MKIPATPPDWRKLVHRLDPGALASGAPTDDTKYLHWDDLRHHTPPAGLDVEAWWFHLKLGRHARRRELSLRDPSGRAFWYALTAGIEERLHVLDRQLGGRLEMPEPLANPAERDRYLVSSLIEEAIESSVLEGAVTTRKAARELIRQGRRPTNTAERMVLNNYSAMEWIRERVEEPLTPDLIVELQRRVAEDALDDPTAAGRLRRPDEEINVVDLAEGQVRPRPPPAEQLPERLERLSAFANGESGGTFIHPLIRAIAVHFALAFEHPFVDGNGRTARALFYWAMLRQGYWLAGFISISAVIGKRKAAYARSFLHSETDENDLTYFVMAHLGWIERAVEALFAYLAKKTGELRRLDSVLRRREDLNYRQRALLAHAVRKPDTLYTIESHQRSHRVTYQTARTDLLELARRGYLEQLKSGRRFEFRPVRELPRHLAGD